MFRRFLIAIVLFLLVVVVVADRVGAIVAAHVLAGKIQTDEHLKNRPSVTIEGVPFLTQAFGGKYSDVRLSGHEVLINEVPVTTLSVDLRGLHLPLSKALGGSVSRVPVDHVTGTGFVSYADANSYLAHHLPSGTSLRLAAGPNNRTVSIVDRVHVAGQHFVLRGDGLISMTGNVVSVDVSGLSSRATSVPTRLVGQALAKLTVAFPLQNFPFRLLLKAITVTSTGLSAVGSADHVVLGAPLQ